MLRTENFRDFNLSEKDDVVEFWQKISKIKYGSEKPKYSKLVTRH